MKVGIDASPLRVPSGGIRRYTEELIHGLLRMDSQHRLVLYGVPIDVPTRSPKLRPFTQIDRDPLHFPGKRFLDRICIAGADRRIDVYHGTNYWAPMFGQIPTVVTIHDLTVQLLPENHPFSRRLAHRLLPAICRRATRIIADSDQTKRDLIQLYHLDDEKIDIVHLGVGSDFRPVVDETALSKVRAKYRLPSRFFLYIGALDPRKNLETLIEAVALLHRGNSGDALVIAGTGIPAYEKRLRIQVRDLGLIPDRDVRFCGYVEERDLAALYSASELFVFPSRYEGFGLPPLEAMACGTPVVLSRNSAMADVFAGACDMVDESDPRILAEAIQIALADHNRRQVLIKHGLELARSRGWENVAAETIAVYERALRHEKRTSKV